MRVFFAYVRKYRFKVVSGNFLNVARVNPATTLSDGKHGQLISGRSKPILWSQALLGLISPSLGFVFVLGLATHKSLVAFNDAVQFLG